MLEKYEDCDNNMYCWPGFLWSLLKDEEIHSLYGTDIWKFIPLQWRHWWLPAVSYHFPLFFNDVSIENPPPIFKDISHEINEWNQDINSFYCHV